MKTWMERNCPRFTFKIVVAIHAIEPRFEKILQLLELHSRHAEFAHLRYVD